MNIRSTSPQVGSKVSPTVPVTQSEAKVHVESVDSFVESSWRYIDKAKGFGRGVAMAPFMGVFSAVPGLGLKLANAHRELQKGDPKTTTLAKVSNLGIFVSQSAGLATAALSAGSYLTGLGDPLTLGQLSLGCFAASGACGVGAALGHDWQ